MPTANDAYTTRTPAERRRARTANIRQHKDRMPVRVTQAKREKIEQAIETLIDTLDRLDGDADLEQDRSDYEMTNGGTYMTDAASHLDDREDDRSDEEQSMGWLSNAINQDRPLPNSFNIPGGKWSCRDWSDDDGEPSLGAPESHEYHDQKTWARGSSFDGEEDIHDQPHDEEPDLENTAHETHGGYGCTIVFDDMEPSLAHTLDTDQSKAGEQRGCFVDGEGDGSAWEGR